MKNVGPKLPTGSECSRWEGIKIHPPLEKDVNHCIVCNTLAPTWWIQMPGQGIRLCNDCREALYNKLGMSFFNSGGERPKGEKLPGGHCDGCEECHSPDGFTCCEKDDCVAPDGWKEEE